MQGYGLEVQFMKNARKGVEYLKKYPEARANDPIEAFSDPSIDMILCAIGGNDTYRLLPYLCEDDHLKKVIRQKVFLGFSDTTINHFMLYKLGIYSFYGQAFLPDVCELSEDILPYTRAYFEELIKTQRIQTVITSDIWYEERLDFSRSSLGTAMKQHKNKGFELLRGEPYFEGEILGGCLESIFDCFDHSRYPDTVSLVKHYDLFPSIEEWENKILFIETSEEQPKPEKFREMIQVIKTVGLFEVLSGMIVGKPQNERYYDAYKQIMIEEIPNEQLSIVYNINIGHATPRCIIPFGIPARVNVKTQSITFDYSAKFDFKSD